MNFELSKTDIARHKCDVVVIGCYKNSLNTGNVKKIDSLLGGALGRKMESDKFDADLGKCISIDTLDRIPANKVIVVGLGTKKDLSPSGIFKASTIVSRAIGRKKSEVLVDLRLKDERWFLSSLIEGLSDGIYSFDKYKTADKCEEKEIRFTINIDSPGSQKNIRGRDYAVAVSGSVSSARDLVNEPPVYLTPSKLADIATELAEVRNLDIEVLDSRQIEEKKMGALLAVARGSEEPPRFIHLTYTPERKARKEIAVVGKGITFDSGGLCLKPADSMRTMKVDMAGAATVMGVMEAVSYIKPDVKVHGIIPATENMTGGRAYKPDDVVYAMNGKSIEIINTDAEGRLILADALSYCKSIKPDEIIDLATLTGACIVALGNFTAGVMGNNSEMTGRFISVSEKVGEKMWELPLEEEIAKELESSVADIKNSGSRSGGAIYAAHFLNNFVPEKTPWVHLDIAGPSYFDKSGEWYSQGGTGFGVRTITRYLYEL